MNELSTTTASSQAISPFSGGEAFKAAKEMAVLLSESSMLPALYRGPQGVGNCLIALELSSRLGVSVFTITQNMDPIQGRPSFKATFLIASINSCGKFSPLRFEYSGTPGTDSRACRCVATDKATGEVLEGTVVSIKMAKAEGWYTRSGSKWPNMPEQMLAYRAGCFWQRLHCPQMSLGLQSKEELEDTLDVDTVPKTPEIKKRTPAPAAPEPTTPATEVIQEAVEVAPTPEPAPDPVVTPDTAPLAPAEPADIDKLRAAVVAAFKGAGISWTQVQAAAIAGEWWDDAATIAFKDLGIEPLEYLLKRVDRIARRIKSVDLVAPTAAADPATT